MHVLICEINAARPDEETRAEPAPASELVFVLNELPVALRFGRPNLCATLLSSSAVNAHEIAANVSSNEKGSFTSEGRTAVDLNIDAIVATAGDFAARALGVLKIDAKPVDGLLAFFIEPLEDSLC